MSKRLFSIFLVIVFSTALASGCQRASKKPLPPNTPRIITEKNTPRYSSQTRPRISAVSYPPAPVAGPGNMGSEFQQRVVALVNTERQRVGHSPLVEDALLDKGASLKADDMRDKAYFSHTSPTFGSPFEQMTSLSVPYQAAAENIAAGFTTPEAVVAGWMNSPGHRANILDDRFGKIGVGYGPGGNAGVYWVQWFTN